MTEAPGTPRRNSAGPVRGLLRVALILLTVVGLAWIAGLLYWHVRISSALRTLERFVSRSSATTVSASEADEAMDTLSKAGCRSLPYLLRSLDERKDGTYLSYATYYIVWESAHPGLPFRDQLPPELGGRAAAWVVEPDATPEECRRKFERIRSWWRERGSEHHQFWRFWTADCRSTGG